MKLEKNKIFLQKNYKTMPESMWPYLKIPLSVLQEELSQSSVCASYLSKLFSQDLSWGVW